MSLKSSPFSATELLRPSSLVIRRLYFEKKKIVFCFFFSNSKSLFNNQLGDYLRKSTKQIFLNNICLTSILQKAYKKDESLIFHHQSPLIEHLPISIQGI